MDNNQKKEKNKVGWIIAIITIPIILSVILINTLSSEFIFHIGETLMLIVAIAVFVFIIYILKSLFEKNGENIDDNANNNFENFEKRYPNFEEKPYYESILYDVKKIKKITPKQKLANIIKLIILIIGIFLLFTLIYIFFATSEVVNYIAGILIVSVCSCGVGYLIYLVYKNSN